MPLSALTGTKLRERRMAARLRQSDVAARAGISPSYLNLIEHNRRKVTPDVMDRLADALSIDRAALAGGQKHSGSGPSTPGGLHAIGARTSAGRPLQQRSIAPRSSRYVCPTDAVR